MLTVIRMARAAQHATRYGGGCGIIERPFTSPGAGGGVPAEDDVSTPKRRSGGATWDRAATEGALEDAALVLLRRNGVLGGINLSEVADEAGVNRGLVYHYFGSRRDLLRAALRKGARARMGELTPPPELDLVERMRLYVRTILRQGEFVRLVVALVLDNDTHVRVLPLKDSVVPQLKQRQADGEVRADIDVEAAHVLQVVSGYGYALLREPIAREMGIRLDELDRRFEDSAAWLARQLLTERAADEAPHAPRSGT